MTREEILKIAGQVLKSPAPTVRNILSGISPDDVDRIMTEVGIMGQNQENIDARGTFGNTEQGNQRASGQNKISRENNREVEG